MEYLIPQDQMPDTEVNESLVDSSFSLSRTISNIYGGTVATGVDIGASLWNSIPGTDEADTEEILGRIGGDSLRVFQENTDTIRTLSFIGGALLPGGAAVKGINLLRNGSKAVNWFTQAGKVAQTSKVKTLFEQGAAGTSEYKKLMWGMRGRAVANNVTDAVAAEAAIIGTMNAHPFMEDYLEDPVSNFAMGVALGGGIGAVGGIIGDSLMLRNVTGKIEQEAWGSVLDEVKLISNAMPEATKLQTNDRTIKGLQGMLVRGQQTGKNPQNDLALSYAEKMLRDLELENGKAFEAMASPEMRSLDAADVGHFLETVKSNPAMWGVQSVRLAEAGDILPLKKVTNNLLSDDPLLKAVNKKTGEMDLKEAVYFQDTGRFGDINDVKLHGGAAALNTDMKTLLKAKPDAVSAVPNFDYSLEHIGRSTPSVEADYVAWTKKFADMGEDDFLTYLKGAVLSAEDIPQLQAMHLKMTSSPLLKAQGRIKIADRLDEAEFAIEGVNAKRTLGGTPLKYQQAADDLLSDSNVVSKYDITKLDPGSSAATQLGSWIGGSLYPLQKAATSYFAKGYSASSRSTADTMLAKNFADVYEHPNSIKARDDIRKTLADKDGKVYVYRGVKTSRLFGQAPLESMTLSVDKTQQFTGAAGSTMLFKVDVEDIVTVLKDVGHGSNNTELIVRTTAREPEAVLGADGRIAYRKSFENTQQRLKVINKAKEATIDEVQGLLQEGKFQLMTSLVAKGFPPEVIAKRLNMPLDTVNQMFATDMTFETFQTMKDIVSFKTAADAEAALGVRNRPMILKGVKGKADYTKHHANLNAQQLNTINTMFTSTAMMNSSSATVRDLAKMIFERHNIPLDLVRTKLAKVNNEFAGSNFFSSADQFLRHMDELGPIFTTIGKDITHLANTTSKTLLEPITDFMTKVSVNEAALAEFNVAANVNASLKGWRMYKDGQFFQKVERVDEAGNPVTVLEAATFQGQPWKAATKETDELLQKIQGTGKELYEMGEVASKITGRGAMHDNGFWMPAMNPVNKFIAYVHDRATDTTRMLYAQTQQQLNDAMKTFDSEIAGNPNLLLVTKDNQQWWSYVNGRADTVHMQTTDAAKLKTGSGASAIVSVNRDILSEIAGGYEHTINSRIRTLADLSMADITDTLRKYSKITASQLEGQPLSFVKRVMSRPKDTGTASVNILLGSSALGEYEGWTSLSRTFEASLAKGSQAVGAVWNTMAPRAGFFGKGRKLDADKMHAFDYEQFSKKLEDAGVVNPFAIYEKADKAETIKKFTLSQGSENPDIPKRIISAGNAMAATMALRMGELAHPLINLMSMPILTALANSKNMPESFLGAARKTRDVGTARIMYEGVRAMNSPRFAALNKKWEDLGYFTPMVSEATEILKASRRFEKGAIASLERTIDSGFVNFMSKPADYSETMSRKVMMNTGAQLAKRLYPELDENGITIFARDFMDKAIGNYSAAQRPVMFQGTVGMALGLFQTYMLTMAQGIYRNIETKDWATLAKASMAQSTIFGVGSMPGFSQVSEMIGTHFSEEHVDLTTGTYRAAGEAADWILYGLPSNLTQSSIFTRGDVDPRFPNVLAGVDNVVAVNMTMQSAEMVSNLARATGEGSNVGQAMLQALSLQTLSRPLGRMAEIGMAATGEGGSINRAGNTVQNSEEVLTFNGIAARGFAMRPFEEAKLREAQYMNRFYEAADKEQRVKAVNELKGLIRSGKNTPEKVAAIAEEYMREGGSPTGWRSAYRTAMARTNVSGEDTFLEDLDTGNPLMHMIDSLD